MTPAQEWLDLSDSALRLRCGEMTAQEIRTVRAVLGAITRAENSEKVPGSISWLGNLRDAANRAIDEAKKLYDVEREQSQFETDSVNWVRVYCYDAMWCRSANGYENGVVQIAHAAPGGAPALCNWVESRLEQLGFPGVVARTEW